ncbi:hypothetical protein BJ165DRAFT_1481570 [Panaeolus papilionaceus]|nr:hypothetical protein BJ165DRAFT_1481570 [Panaeolus papilionaceus]
MSSRYNSGNLEETTSPNPDAPSHHDIGQDPTNSASDFRILDDIMKKALDDGQPDQHRDPLPLPSVKVEIPQSAQGRTLPVETWRVLSSWDIVNPTRNAIPRAFEDLPKEKSDLLRSLAYKSQLEKKRIEASERLLAAHKAVHECEAHEVTLLLGVERLSLGSDGWLASSFALSVARAARKSLQARIKLSEARLTQVNLDLQAESDSLEEALVAAGEADHQLYPILSSFLAKGWPLFDLPVCIVEETNLVFPSPQRLSQIKAMLKETHGTAPNAVPSLSAVSSLSCSEDDDPNSS